MIRRDGFTLAEFLIAGAVALVLTAGLLTVVDPSHSATRARAAAIDIQQRLRAASEAMSADLYAAGSGPVNGVFGKSLGTITPVILPFRVGPRGDPAGTARSDAISLITTASSGAAAVLTATFVPALGVAQIAATPACPVGDLACGIGVGAAVLLLDGRGQSDLFNVTVVAGGSLSLEPRGMTSSRSFPPGALLVPVTVTSYYLRPGSTSEGAQLMSGDGDRSDMPFVDYVAGLTIELLGDPQPPRLSPAGASPHAATYGPVPPPLGVDDGRDDWPAGENCTFLASGGEQRSRLATLPPGAGPVLLPHGTLTDGPWCPDSSAPNRFDADLLRVRAVRVTIRFEATSATVRGIDARLFVHPGTSRDPSGWAADRQVVFDVVPRALHVGR